MAIEIVNFPINSMVIFHGKMLVHQRVDLMYQVLVDGWIMMDGSWYFPYDETQLLLSYFLVIRIEECVVIRGWQELKDSLLITPVCGEICEL